MADKTIVDYEQMQDIARKFYAEGDELTRLLLQTRQKVHETQADWIGRGADSFNDDMDNKILPALQRFARLCYIQIRLPKRSWLFTTNRKMKPQPL